jgi:hypothetical protein
MPRLDGSSRVVELAPGYRIAAPGVRGTATALAGVQPGSRGPEVEPATEAFTDALRQSGMAEVQLVVVDVEAMQQPRPDEELRTPAGDDGLLLEVPDLGPDVGQVVLAVDEDGAMSWNFPLDAGGTVQPPTVRGSHQAKRFLIRSTMPAIDQPGRDADRGLVGLLGQKLLKVLVYPVADAVLGPVSERFAAVWESRHRPYGIRGLEPATYRSARSTGVSPDDWRRWTAGRSLLLLHGTFSTSHGAFWSLPPETMSELYRLYEGRVLAFDHPSMSVDPLANAQELARFVPDGSSLDVDVIAHSRGGLVARALVGELDGPVAGLRVNRAVLVGCPFHGTPLADADHLVEYLDRVTTLLNLVPPGPASVVTEVLESVITAVKVVGHAALRGLPGISAMDPQGPFLARFGQTEARATYYGVASDYEPVGGLRSLARRAGNLVLDRVFQGAANDLVVPTLTVDGGEGPPAPIPAQRVLMFERHAAVDHSGYFREALVGRRLVEWLSA